MSEAITEKTYLKVLNADGQCYHGGSGSWALPHDGEPGEWMPKLDGKLELCARAYHVVTVSQVLPWAAPALFVVETKGRMVHDTEKHGCREARLLRKVETWNDRNLRRFACDCAERALTHVKVPDPRSVEAIAVSRRFADGQATSTELAAARAAARAAAKAAARAAAWDAAWAAARDVAWDAAWAAAWDAARAAERAAAWAAAWDAARAAAWDAAWAAERKWQTALLLQYLNGEMD